MEKCFTVVLLRDRWWSITLDWRETVTRTLWPMRQDNGLWLRCLHHHPDPQTPSSQLRALQTPLELQMRTLADISTTATNALREEHVYMWEKLKLDTPPPGCFNYHHVHVTAKLAIFDAPVFRSPEIKM